MWVGRPWLRLLPCPTRAYGLVCVLVGVTPYTRVYAGDDPVGEVLSLNLHRRHLSTSQRAAVAALSLPYYESEAKKRQVRKPESVTAILPEQNTAGESREKAAEALNVSPRYVSDAKKVLETSPETFEKLKSGEIIPLTHKTGRFVYP